MRPPVVCGCASAAAAVPARRRPAPAAPLPAPPPPATARDWPVARYELFDDGGASLGSVVRTSLSPAPPHDLGSARFSLGAARDHVTVDLTREKPAEMLYETGMARVWEAAIALTVYVRGLNFAAPPRVLDRDKNNAELGRPTISSRSPRSSLTSRSVPGSFLETE